MKRLFLPPKLCCAVLWKDKCPWKLTTLIKAHFYFFNWVSAPGLPLARPPFCSMLSLHSRATWGDNNSWGEFRLWLETFLGWSFCFLIKRYGSTCCRCSSWKLKKGPENVWKILGWKRIGLVMVQRVLRSRIGVEGCHREQSLLEGIPQINQPSFPKCVQVNFLEATSSSLKCTLPAQREVHWIFYAGKMRKLLVNI